MKNQYRGGIAYKGGLGQFADLRGGGLGKKEGSGAFEGGLILQCTLCRSTTTRAFVFLAKLAGLYYYKIFEARS